MISALAFVLFCAVCTVLAFARHPIYGLYFYFASIFVHPSSRWWGYMVPDLRWSLLSAAVTVLAIVLHRGRLGARPIWLSNAPALILATYATWMCIQTPWALDADAHLAGSTQFLKYLIAFWFVYRLTDSTEMLRHLMFGHAAGCTLLGLYALFTGREGGRLDGVGGPGMDDANTLGMYLATGVITCMGLFMTSKGWLRWFFLVLMAIIGNGFVLANSRGAFLGLVAGGLTIAVVTARENRRVLWALALVGVLGFAHVADEAFIDRMFTIGDVVEEHEEADMSARSRTVIYDAQLRMAADYPLGSGHKGTAELSPYYLDRRWLTGDDASAARSSHNTFMTTLVEQGIPGATLFLMLVGWVMGSLFRIRRLNIAGSEPEPITLGASLCGGVMVVIVAGLATDYLLAEVQFWLLAALVSALQIARRHQRGAASPREDVRSLGLRS